MSNLSLSKWFAANIQGRPILQMQRQLCWAGDFTKAKSTYPSRHPICTDSTIWTALVHFLIFLGQGVKKRYFTVSVPPSFTVSFLLFFGVPLTLSESDFIHEKKSIFIQLLQSPIPPLTAAALRMIICKRLAPHFDNHKKGMKNASLRPFTMR